MKSPGFVIGHIARGDDFWNRESEVNIIWETLEKDNILLKSPRRFGKTSIMNFLYENPKSDYRVFFQDTESVREPEEFISGIVALLLTDSVFRKIYRSMSGMMKELLGRIEVRVGYEEMPDIRIKIKEALKDDWQGEGRRLIAQLQKYNGKILFILDELPELIKNIEKKKGNEIATDFLHWFRSIRQMPELSHIRWLIGGSIGIEHIVDKIKAGIKTINDFKAIRIEPFSEEEGREFIKALLKKEGGIQRIGRPILDKFMDTIGAPVPYFIQILLSESLYETKRAKRKTPTSEIIEKAYKERLLGPTNRTYFQHYYTRLKEYYDSEIEAIAKRLLIEIAKMGEVKKSELLKLFKMESKGRYTTDDFSYLMTDLENDFYVSYGIESDSYYFATKVLRDWWLRYYDMVEVES